MTASVLDCISLSYQPLWGRDRRLAGVGLSVWPTPSPPVPGPVDAADLLAALDRALPAGGGTPLFLVPRSADLLLGLLAVLAPASGGGTAPTLVVPDFLLRADGGDGMVAAGVRLAARRGLRLVWQGGADAPPADGVRDAFHRYWLSLPPPWAAAALRDATRKPAAGGQPGPGRLPPGHIYGEVESRVLMEYCLDRCKSLALAGWPDEDIVHGLLARGQAPQPSHAVVLATLKALEGDRSAETVERVIGEDPLLVYRFLIHANSPALGLRHPIESVRHGMMMLGVDTLRRWLGGQLPHAGRDTALRPVNARAVLRSRLMTRLLDAGIEETLRREVSLCGLFSGLDLLLGEPAAVLLGRIRMSQRVQDAVVQRSGPYGASLEVALALESPDPSGVLALCERHEISPGWVNRALLDVLSGVDGGGVVV